MNVGKRKKVLLLKILACKTCRRYYIYTPFITLKTSHFGGPISYDTWYFVAVRGLGIYRLEYADLINLAKII